MHDDDLDAELRRLFSDDRLSLPVAANAEEQVFAGIARRRKRKGVVFAVAGAVLTVVLVFGGALLVPGSLGGNQDRADPPDARPSLSISTPSGSGQPSATSSSPPSATAPTGRPPVDGGDASSPPDGANGGGPVGGGGDGGGGGGGGGGLPGRPSGPEGTLLPGGGMPESAFGPDGYGEYKFGIPSNGIKDDDLAEQQPRPPAAPGRCKSYALRNGLMLSFANDKLVKITNTSPDIRTAEGVGIGDTRARVEEVYQPDELSAGSQVIAVPAPRSKTGARYTFNFADNNLTRIVLALPGGRSC